MPPADGLRVGLVVEQLWQPVPGGSGTYVRALANGLLTVPDVNPHGVTARDDGTGRHGLDSRLELRRSYLPRKVLYESWCRLRAPRAPGWRRTDVVHATTWAVPPSSSPLVVTVHDVAFLREPGHFTSHGAAYFRRALAITRAEAARVIVPSEATAQDCADAGIDRARIRVIPHGVQVDAVAHDDVRALQTTYGLTRPYVLWVGTLEPRKNLPALLTAYALLLDHGVDLDLVLVGPDGWGPTSEEVGATIRNLGRHRVHRLGRLSRKELAAAYAGAQVFCFPSSWEGFGLPVLEAQAHGVPVVTSAGTSMHEVCGGSAIAVDPQDAPELAHAIERAAGAERDHLVSLGYANAARYTWPEAIRATADVYAQVQR
ncbi:MAG: glycosyltransferase family 4 protein [Cellulomonadaceae bacterium]